MFPYLDFQFCSSVYKAVMKVFPSVTQFSLLTETAQHLPAIDFFFFFKFYFNSEIMFYLH